MLIKKGIELLHTPRMYNTEIAGTLRNTHASENTVSEGRKNLRVRALFCPQQRSSGEKVRRMRMIASSDERVLENFLEVVGLFLNFF